MDLVGLASILYRKIVLEGSKTTMECFRTVLHRRWSWYPSFLIHLLGQQPRLTWRWQLLNSSCSMPHSSMDHVRSRRAQHLIPPSDPYNSPCLISLDTYARIVAIFRNSNIRTFHQIVSGIVDHAVGKRSSHCGRSLLYQCKGRTAFLRHDERTKSDASFK